MRWAEIPPVVGGHHAFFHPDPARPGRMYTRAGGFVADIDKFDAAFFGISPREARRIDPQQRILLELTWESSGGCRDRSRLNWPARRPACSSAFPFPTTRRFRARGAGQRRRLCRWPAARSSNAANRISYIFSTCTGRASPVDTACSSSLVAVHEACVSLRRGRSSTAIVGGINALLSPSGTVGFSKAHMLSPTGRCRPFDAAGDGYVRSEGGGIFVLKPLADAIAEGNRVYAVIVGSGVNSDGRTSGLAVPNQAAQAALLRRLVYQSAGIDPGEIDYIEAHGTGTGVGDPIECGALGEGDRRVAGARRSLPDPVRSRATSVYPGAGLGGVPAACSSSGSSAASPRDPRHLALQDTQPRDFLRRAQPVGGVGIHRARSRPVDHGGQLVRLRRHQRPYRDPGASSFDKNRWERTKLPASGRVLAAIDLSLRNAEALSQLAGSLRRACCVRPRRRL